MFENVEATKTERAEARAGDELVSPADVVMDRAFTVPGTPEDVWPWILQLGKRRAGWYLSRRVERFIPPGRRAIRSLDARWQSLVVGDDVPDYGGRDETFTVAEIDDPHMLVYRSRRRVMLVTWSITLRPVSHGPAGGGSASDSPVDIGAPQTRVLLRLRMGPIKRGWLAKSGGELIDLLTIAGMATGLRERLVAADRER